MKAKESCRACITKVGAGNILLIATIVSVVLGVALGVTLQAVGPKLTPKEIKMLKFPGEIFIKALKMIVLPLVACSLISSLAGLDSQSAGKIGSRAFIYYITTTFIAVATGILLVETIRPGTKGGDTNKNTEGGKQTINKCFGGNAGDTIMDLIRNIFPSNLVRATMQAQHTCYSFAMKDGNNSVNIPTNEALEYLSGNETLAGLITQVPLTVYTDSTNILGIVVFSVVFGIVIGRYRSKCQVLIDFIEASEFAIVKIVMVIIWFSPIGILFLIAGQIVAISDPVTEMKRLGWYMLTVVAGLTIHGLVTLLLILGLLGRRNPFKFIAGMSQALLTAVGTSSSSATMPLTMRCLEENLDVDTRIVRFMIPLGATVNMDGTALYEAVACIYIAQYAGITLTLGEVILTSLTATVASIGAAGLPGAGLITLMMVLMAVNLPADLFILIVPVDWFLDRVRTTINVLGDAIGCAVVQQMCKTHLHSVDSMAQLVHTQSSNTPAPGESIDPEQPIQGIHPTSVAGTPMFHDTNEVRDAKGSQTNINVPTDPVTKTEEPRTSSAVSQGKTSSNLGGLLTSSEHKDIGKDNGSVCSTGWQSRNGEFDVVPLAISDSLASVAMHNASSQSSLPGAPK